MTLLAESIVIEMYERTYVVNLYLTYYPAGGAKALVLHSIEGPFATLSVNIPEHKLADDEVLVKTWSENERIIEPVLATGLFEDTGRRVPTGYCEAQVWRLTDAAKAALAERGHVEN